jgi:phytoene/squalene synthetase
MLCDALLTSHRVFPISIELWTDFFSAMRSDIAENAISRWDDFLAYAAGAAVAPTTIYLSLIAGRRDDGVGPAELPRGFNLYECGRHLGIFAYLAHIIRDLAKDILDTPTRLCMACEDMAAHGVNLEMLRSEARRGRASPATRSLVGELLQRARWHLAEGKALAAPVRQTLDSDCRFVLELIIAIYEQVIAKIEACGRDPMAERHFLTRREQSEIVSRVAARTGFPLPSMTSA